LRSDEILAFKNVISEPYYLGWRYSDVISPQQTGKDPKTGKRYLLDLAHPYSNYYNNRWSKYLTHVPVPDPQIPGINRFVINPAIDIYAKIIKDDLERRTFRELMLDGNTEKAYQILKKSPNYNAYQFDPNIRTAVYPGGLDLKIFELFPDLEVAHFINRRPFRVNHAIDLLRYRDSNGSPLSGQEALRQMKSDYLKASATEELISDVLQLNIIEGYREDRKIDPKTGLWANQIGMEPFITADLQRMGATVIRVDIVDQFKLTYAIHFKDIFGNPKVIYYHEANILKENFSNILEDLLKYRKIDLLFIKAFSHMGFISGVVHIPERFYSGLKPNGLYVTDFLGDIVTTTAGLRKFNFGGIQRSLEYVNPSLAGPDSVWGRLGDKWAPLSVFRVHDFAMRGQVRGGIDLTPANMNVQVKTGSPIKKFGDDTGLKFHLDPAMLAELRNAPGFVPVIINIEPMTDLKRFLGVTGENVQTSG